MPGEHVKIHGLDLLMKKFRELAVSNPEIGDEPLNKFSQEMTVTLGREPYPPELPNQKYIRTYQFKNSWFYKKADIARYKIINDARNPKSGEFYAGWVAGTKQAPIHIGRWWQAVKVVKRHIKTLSNYLNTAYQKVWKS